MCAAVYSNRQDKTDSHLQHNFIKKNAITQFLICYWFCTESLNLNTHNYHSMLNNTCEVVVFVVFVHCNITNSCV